MLNVCTAPTTQPIAINGNRLFDVVEKRRPHTHATFVVNSVEA